MEIFKTNVRKAIKIFAGIVVVLVVGNFVLAPVMFLFYPGLLGIGIALSSSPAKPTIRYGEFPFRLVYEVNGEQMMIEDTIICKYDGIGMDTGRGKFRKWKSWFLSSGEEVTYQGVTILKDAEKTIYMEVGGAHYYMGDWENLIYESSESQDFENIFRIDPVGKIGGTISKKELLEKYNIKIIEWTHAPPIKNTFKKSLF